MSTPIPDHKMKSMVSAATCKSQLNVFSMQKNDDSGNITLGVKIMSVDGKVDFKWHSKAETSIQVDNIQDLSRQQFEDKLAQVFPLKLRMKIKREWIESGGRSGRRQTATIYSKYDEVFSKCE